MFLKGDNNYVVTHFYCISNEGFIIFQYRHHYPEQDLAVVKSS